MKKFGLFAFLFMLLCVPADAGPGLTSPFLVPVSQLPTALQRSDKTIIRVVHLGDSLVYGAGGPYALPGPRGDLSPMMRQKRGDFAFIGTLRDGAAASNSPYWPWTRYVPMDFNHEGHSGFTVDQLTGATLVSITNVSASGTLIEYTTATNNLSTGQVVGITGVVGTGGLTANANRAWCRITVIDTTHFTCNASTFVGAYTSGGSVTTGWPVYSAYYASMGWTPDLVYVLAGANNITQGDSASTVATKLGTLIDTIHASYPKAIVAVEELPPVPSFTSVSSALNTALPGVCGARLNTAFENSAASLNLAQQNGDVHPNNWGNTIIAGGQLGVFESYFPMPHGLPFPRQFHHSPVQTAFKAVATTDYAQFGGSAVEPGAGNWWVAVSFQPSSLVAVGTNKAILSYGDTPNDYNHGYTLLTDGPDLSLYVNPNGGPALFQVTSILSTGRLSRIVVTADSNAQDPTIALWVNGMLTAVAGVSLPWSAFSGEHAYIGGQPLFSAAPGLYRDLQFGKGSAVPGFADPNLRKSIEADYYEQVQMPGETAWWPLSEASGTVVTDLVGGITANISGATVGNAFSTPWDSL